MADSTSQTKENITGYVTAEQRPFDQLACTDVDLLVFSAITYFEFERFPRYGGSKATPLSDLAKYGKARSYVEHDCNPRGMLDLLLAVVASNRFGDVELDSFRCILDDTRPVQFGAATYWLDDAHTQGVIAFRGTDTSLAGWYEDLLMMSEPAIEGEKEALRYVEETVASHPRARFIVCGHSKGGTCAQYACLFASAETARAIDRGVSFDGPALTHATSRACPDFRAYDEDVEKRLAACPMPFKRYLFQAQVGRMLETRPASAFTCVANIDPKLTHNVCSQQVKDGAFVPWTPTAQEEHAGGAFTRLAQQLTRSQRRFAADFVKAACADADIVPDLGSEGSAKTASALKARYRAGSFSERRQARKLLTAYLKAQ